MNVAVVVHGESLIKSEMIAGRKYGHSIVREGVMRCARRHAGSA
jgi:hypothetical protein